MKQEDYDKIREALETLYSDSMLQRLVDLIPEPEYEPKVGDLFQDEEKDLWLCVEDWDQPHPFMGPGRFTLDARNFDRIQKEYGLKRVIP